MDDITIKLPEHYQNIWAASDEISFSMPSDLQTGSLLRTLVTAKPKGQFLELGTGTGLSLSWIVEAMDAYSSLISIDNNETFLSIARRHFEADARVSILCEDGAKWIQNHQDQRFDLIFADAWPGKYEMLHETLHLVKPGGFYIIDDMQQQANWPAGHEVYVNQLVNYLETRTDLRLTKMNWSTGLIVVAKINSN